MTNEQLYDKILACWMGKNIGGTLGAPVEGAKEVLHFTGLTDFKAQGPLPNDDLDLQLLNLHVMEQNSNNPTTEDFSREWMEHVHFPFDEYGYALANIRLGMRAPFSGYYNNPFINCMGCPIRSELWANISPNNPERAIFFAQLDGAVDHAGGEGIYGEIFFAALESLAFENDCMVDLVEKALQYVPEDNRVYHAVLSVLDWYRDGVTYEYIRNMIISSFGDDNFTDAPQNIAFTVVGLLYGKSFEDGMLKTINLGYDTDCTCATFGSVYGIINGTKGIPDEWKATVGNEINLSEQITGLDYPKTLDELTERTIAVKNRIDADIRVEHKMVELDVTRQYFYLPCNSSSRNLEISVKSEKGICIDRNGNNGILVNIKNIGIEVINAKVKLSGSGKTYDVDLRVGESRDLLFPADNYNEKFSCANYVLQIERYYKGQLWTEYKLDIVIPLSVHWLVDGNRATTEGNFIKVPDGMHKFETSLSLNEDKTVKIITTSKAKVKTHLDGEVVIEAGTKHAYMPAFHRCPSDQYKIALLKKGKHYISVTTDSEGDAVLAVIPCTVESTNCVDNAYVIDCVVGDSIG